MKETQGGTQGGMQETQGFATAETTLSNTVVILMRATAVDQSN